LIFNPASPFSTLETTAPLDDEMGENGLLFPEPYAGIPATSCWTGSAPTKAHSKLSDVCPQRFKVWIVKSANFDFLLVPQVHRLPQPATRFFQPPKLAGVARQVERNHRLAWEPSLSATNTFKVIVTEVNSGPVLPFQTDRPMNELTTLVVAYA